MNMSATTRNRLLNAMVFFAQRTLRCDLSKLSRLLFLLDFEHFRRTGLSVTGSEYAAWKTGPVPVALYEEWESPAPDFLRIFNFVPDRRRDSARKFLQPKVDFDDSDFTPRQLNLMAALAAEHREVPSENIDIVSAFHGAWFRVWANGEGRNRRIPYELALTPGDPLSEIAYERHRAESFRVAAHQALFSSR